jgi:SPX domain protein involved in polyphosphate accumulation
MKHLLVSVYNVVSNKSPLVKIGPAPGSLILFMCIAKTYKFFFDKTQIARVKIFSMKHLPVSVFKVCSNKALGSKLALLRGTLIFLISV